jgi:hypothetical protein
MMRWNREAAMLGIPDLPEEGFKHVGDRKIKPQGGGGGSQTSTSYTSSVPKWLESEQKDVVARGFALADQPYQPYTGERTSQFTPLQRQAFGQAQTQGVAPQLGMASGLAGLASQQALGAGQFQPGTFTPMGVQAPQLQQFQLGAPMGVGTQSFTQPGTAQQFMDPYMQNVVNIQQQAAQRQADIAATQRGAQAVRAGAFGGSRQAIENAEANRALASQMGEIQARGLQDSFRQAQDMFGREQQLGLQAQMANQQAGLTAGQANLQSLLQTQGLGAQTGMQAQLANQQALMDAQRAFEQSRQFGADLGLRGTGQALQGAQTLGQLGQQQFGQEMDIMGARERLGGTQQQQIQRILDQQYADFQAQRDFPYQQLGFMSDLIQGRGGSTRSVFSSPQPGAAQTLAGLGTAAAGLLAKGGSVQHYADGGITGLLGDQELAQTAQNPAQGPMMQMAAQQQMAENAALRAAAPQGLPQPMVEDTVDPVEAGMIIEMQKALNEGDRQRAEALAETIEKRREERAAQEEMGIAAVADDSIGDIPEGGITGMEPVMAAEGGELRFSARGAVPIVLPAGTPRWMVEQTRMENPGVEVRSEDEGSKYRAVGRALTYSSDVEAQRARAAANAAGGGRGIMAGPTAEQLAQAPRPAVPKVVQTPPADVAKKDDKPAPGPMDQGIAAAVVPRSGFNTQAAMADEFGAQQGIAASLVQGADEAIAAQEKEIQERGVLGEEREKRLREQEAGLTGKKGEAKSMALIQAGLAILSADPSRGGLAAIGEGALKGLGAYKGDIKDLEEKRERILEKIDEVNDLRRQEKMADGKERRALVAQRNAAITEGQKLMATTMARFTDINREDANIIADRVFRKELASLPSGEERILRALGDGDLAKGFERSKQLGQKPADLMGEFNDFLKANPLLSTASPDKQMAAFFRTKMTLGGINVPTPTDKPTGRTRD